MIMVDGKYSTLWACAIASEKYIAAGELFLTMHIQKKMEQIG
jgi:hypothetical protein